MKLEKIKVSNFKCFKNINIDLINFNVIIGKNASGKSNIINIIKFIKDMLVNGIDEAIDLQGGINYLYNSSIKAKEPIKIEFDINTYDEETFRMLQLFYEYENEIIMLEKYKVMLVIRPNKQGSGYKILENRVKLYYHVMRLKKNKEKKYKKGYALDYRLEDYIEKDTIIQECYEKDGRINEIFSKTISEELKERLEIHERMFMSRALLNDDEKLLLTNYVPILYIFQLNGGEKIKIYDFNPKNLKSASVINKKNILEEDGSNIANVLQRILKSAEEKKKLLFILKKLMPFVEDISTEKSFNKSMIFRVKENNKNNLPSVLLSDGTVNIIAIIIALYFEKNNDVVIIEEPEKNIHPKLANQLVNLMKDIGIKKQIIITTHNTQLLSSVELNDVIYVYRNRKMFSDIERPENSERVKEFIKNELDIGDLFYDGLFTEKEG